MDKVTIVGAGLCGTLLAIRLAQRGFQVDLHEKRVDLRNEKLDAGRSINLALSHRGLKALALAGLEDQVRKDCIPMHGRMLHLSNGDTRLSPYSGRDDEYINSISRPGLNALLLDKAATYPNVNIHFESQCLDVDLVNAEGKFKQPDGTVNLIASDLIIGTDGAGSIVRKSMMSKTTSLLFNYSQDFLRHGYKELSIKATVSGGYSIEKNALHIWPRGKFMVIALPNLDGSFTVTMFHPYQGEAGFETLNTPEKVKAFFAEHYPDLLVEMPHLGEEYFDNPVGTLGTIKCYPWQAYGKSLIMGDASHAIVPFYGQGMNASFEDVLVFDKYLDEYGSNWEKVLYHFQEERVKDANAIADLAIDNFHEMQNHVADPYFARKRALEMKLEQGYENYRSKYSLVTFLPELSYSQAKAIGRAQDEWLLDAVKSDKDQTEPLDKIYQALEQLKATFI